MPMLIASTMRPSLTTAFLASVFCSACASTFPSEPPLDRQLWNQQGCFAHILPDWQQRQARTLEGIILAHLSEPTPLPGARVFARSIKGGSTLQATADADGHFVVTVPSFGTYEVSVCADGFNPWRGFVLISPRAAPGPLALSLNLGA